jgi:hypothetical protein
VEPVHEALLVFRRSDDEQSIAGAQTRAEELAHHIEERPFFFVKLHEVTRLSRRDEEIGIDVSILSRIS